MSIKRWVKYMSCDGGKSSYFCPETGETRGQNESNPNKTSIAGYFPDGNHVLVIDYGIYTLRDDMERKLRQKFYKVNVRTGEKEQLFTELNSGGCQLPAALIVENGERFIISASRRDGNNQLILSDPSGGESKVIVDTDGYPYGFAFSPDRAGLAFHLAGGSDRAFNPGGCYALNLIDTNGENRRLLCCKSEHLLFGPAWSADGKRLLFLDCYPKADPAHHFADICTVNADGSGFTKITDGYSHYFGTSFGLPEFRGGGSNCPIWTKDGRIIGTPMSPYSHNDSRYDPAQRSHEENIYCPENARGGSVLASFDLNGNRADITKYEEGKWDFRASLSPDGDKLLYTSVKIGKASEIRMCGLAGADDAFVTSGNNGHGADFGSFVYGDDGYIEFLASI